MVMPTYKGSCHCGRVKFEVAAEFEWVTECNCSLCRRKGALYQKAEVEQFRILSGEDALTTYRFNTGAATHYFCRYCGIHPFHRPRLAPERWSVNVRCLDDVDLSALEVRPFDGQNWEAAAGVNAK
jgi:hypothetical protein